MTPKEEAKSIYGSMYIQMTEGFILGRKEQAKQCALIAVEKIINELHHPDFDNTIFWEEVKTEIEKL